MKKDAIKVTTVLLMLIFVMGLTSVAGCILYSFQFQKTYAATYEEKLNRIQSIEGEKAVFVGGSSCMFGVHTANFEEQTGIPSVNMAVSAGIPMKFYLDSINPHLNEGDSLFLCFEYGYYTSYKWNMIGESGLNFLLYQDKSILNKVDKIELIKSIPDFVTVGWKNWENLIQEYIKNDLMNGYGVYTRNCINEQGDMVAHKGVEGEKLVANTALLDDGFHGDEVLSELKKYTENLTERGINVYMVWPPVMSEHYDSAARTLSELKQNMEDIDSVTVLGDPKEYTYAVNQFFDTNDHLTYETGIEHTQTIIDNFLEHKS